MHAPHSAAFLKVMNRAVRALQRSTRGIRRMDRTRPRPGLSPAFRRRRALAAHQAAAAADLHSPQKAVEFVIAVCQCHVFYVALTVVDLVVFSNFLLHFVVERVNKLR